MTSRELRDQTRLAAVDDVFEQINDLRDDLRWMGTEANRAQSDEVEAKLFVMGETLTNLLVHVVRYQTGDAAEASRRLDNEIPKFVATADVEGAMRDVRSLGLSHTMSRRVAELVEAVELVIVATRFAFAPWLKDGPAVDDQSSALSLRRLPTQIVEAIQKSVVAGAVVADGAAALRRS
jgi:hypothetical protein